MKTEKYYSFPSLFEPQHLSYNSQLGEWNTKEWVPNTYTCTNTYMQVRIQTWRHVLTDIDTPRHNTHTQTQRDATHIFIIFFNSGKEYVFSYTNQRSTPYWVVLGTKPVYLILPKTNHSVFISVFPSVLSILTLSRAWLFLRNEH